MICFSMWLIWHKTCHRDEILGIGSIHYLMFMLCKSVEDRINVINLQSSVELYIDELGKSVGNLVYKCKRKLLLDQ